MEVNAGQFATFQCTANGGTDSSDRLWLQVIPFFPNTLISGERRESKRNEKSEKFGLSISSLLDFILPLNCSMVGILL